jgi:hypothetical protein
MSISPTSRDNNDIIQAMQKVVDQKNKAQLVLAFGCGAVTMIGIKVLHDMYNTPAAAAPTPPPTMFETGIKYAMAIGGGILIGIGEEIEKQAFRRFVLNPLYAAGGYVQRTLANRGIFA